MGEEIAEKAKRLLRRRICDSNFVYSAFSDSPDSNYSKIRFMINNSVTDGCNNSMLLLGPSGCGKIEILGLVLRDLQTENPQMISVVRLDGHLHSDNNYAFKEIARQLCSEHQLLFSKVASSDDNTQFMMAVLREYGLAHMTIVFVLDEFDLFTQGKQRLLYSLLDAMQSVKSQAVVIGVSCKLDADQLLEKRVRSRFSHRKFVFHHLSNKEIEKLVQYTLTLPADSSLPDEYVAKFNAQLRDILADQKFKKSLDALADTDNSVRQCLKFLFRAVCDIESRSGLLSFENFKVAISSLQSRPKLEILRGCSVLELYILVCIKRLESKEQNSYNFNSVMKEYKEIQDSYKTSDSYARNVCLRALEHLLQRQLICFMDSKGHRQSIEFRPTKLLISSHELFEGLKSNTSCPPLLLKLIS